VHSVDAVRASSQQGARTAPVAGDEHHVATPPLTQFVEVIEQRLEVGPSAGCEHRNTRTRHRARNL
jgi:hypothetical protein